MVVLTPRLRSLALATVLWLFGLSTSVLLVGLWGRSVANDGMTLEAGARAVLESEFVTHRVNGWLVEGVSAAGNAADPEQGIIDDVLAAERVETAMSHLVEEAVVAALTPPGEPVEADVAGAVDEFATAVASELASRGLPTDADPIRRAALAAANGMLDDEGTGRVAQTANRARSFLTKVTGVGLAAILLFGWLAVRLSEDRVQQIRSLANRLLVSGLTFALFLRLGAWAVDPSGGRSPLATGSAVLLSSNGHVPLTVAVTAAAVVAAAGVVIRSRRRPVTAPAGDVDDDELLPLG